MQLLKRQLQMAAFGPLLPVVLSSYRYSRHCHREAHTQELDADKLAQFHANASPIAFR
jgi:hypothetical protein